MAASAGDRGSGRRRIGRLSIDEVTECDVTREQITAVLDFVAESLRVEPVPAVLILIDHGTPKGLIGALPGHTVHTAQAKGWDTLSHGALLKAADDAADDVLLTTDRRIRYQQNLSAHRIALVVLTGSTRWTDVRTHIDRMAAAVSAATLGTYTEVEQSRTNARSE